MIATHFIEVVKYSDGNILMNMNPVPMRNIEWALQATVKFGYQTIAVFKIYPNPEPIIASYDNEVKSIIIEA